MAIIQCPECGKDISNQAESCPHCGKMFKSDSLTQDMAEVYARRNKNEKAVEKTTGCLVKVLLACLGILIIGVLLCILW